MGCPGAQGRQPVLPPDLGGLSQKHEGRQEQEGHEGATLTGHGLVLRLHSAPTAPAASAATEAEPGGGHQQEVEAGDHGTHHVACLIPNHLGKAARHEAGGGGQPCLSSTPGQDRGGEKACVPLLIPR